MGDARRSGGAPEHLLGPNGHWLGCSGAHDFGSYCDTDYLALDQARVLVPALWAELSRSGMRDREGRRFELVAEDLSRRLGEVEAERDLRARQVEVLERGHAVLLEERDRFLTRWEVVAGVRGMPEDLPQEEQHAILIASDRFVFMHAEQATADAETITRLRKLLRRARNDAAVDGWSMQLSDDIDDELGPVERLAAAVDEEEPVDYILSTSSSSGPALPAAAFLPVLGPAVVGVHEALDFGLLAKLASGEGGARTGPLGRAGLLEWTVTAKGRELLEALPGLVQAIADDGSPIRCGTFSPTPPPPGCPKCGGRMTKLVKVAGCQEACSARWTSTAPTEPGFYWYRNPSYVATPVRVAIDGEGALRVYWTGSINRSLARLADDGAPVEWAGPITEPLS